MKKTLKIISLIFGIGLLILIAITLYTKSLIDKGIAINKEASFIILERNQIFTNVQTNQSYKINLEGNDTIYYFYFWSPISKPSTNELGIINRNYNRIFKDKTKLITVCFDKREKINSYLENKNYLMNFYYADSASFFIKTNSKFLPRTVMIQNNKIIASNVGSTVWSEIK